MTALLVASASALRADPFFWRAPAQSPAVQLGIPLLALVAESIVVGVLVGERRWLHYAVLWFPITFLTFLLFIVLPTIDFGWAITSPQDVTGLRLLVIECAIVLIEGAALWWLWLRRGQRSFRESLLISVVGNSVSYGISLALFHYAFIPQRF